LDTLPLANFVSPQMGGEKDGQMGRSDTFPL
jgi:hypothetical protein